MIWSETERKLTKDEVKLAQAEQLASEMVAAIEVVPEEKPTQPPTRAHQPNISAIWNETAAKPIKNAKSIWGPTPADQVTKMAKFGVIPLFCFSPFEILRITR